MHMHMHTHVLCNSFSLLVLLLQLDMVAFPSWQAQLRGRKTWTVAPQPECEQICATFNVTVNTGDICELHTHTSHTLQLQIASCHRSDTEPGCQITVTDRVMCTWASACACARGSLHVHGHTQDHQLCKHEPGALTSLQLC